MSSLNVSNTINVSITQTVSAAGFTGGRAIGGGIISTPDFNSDDFNSNDFDI